MPVEQPSPLHRAAKVASDWRAIVTLFLMLCSGVAFALKYKFATKNELSAVKTDVAKHNEELSAIGQSLKDIRETQDRELQWLWDLKSSTSSKK